MLNRKRADRTPSSHDTSLIARGTIIRGDVRFSGALHLDGRIEGSVQADESGAVFTLSENGVVQGEIRVPHAIINGHVHGDIHADERLELAPEARITGDVHYRTLEMAAGAQVNGRMSHHAAEATRELPSPTLAGIEVVPA
jgi:cytoskeletal protein CcmA (bactofilin family)